MKGLLIVYAGDNDTLAKAKAHADSWKMHFRRVRMNDARRFNPKDFDQADAIAILSGGYEYIAESYGEETEVVDYFGDIPELELAPEPEIESIDTPAGAGKEVMDVEPEQEIYLEATGEYYAKQRDDGSRWFDVVAPDGLVVAKNLGEEDALFKVEELKEAAE